MLGLASSARLTEGATLVDALRTELAAAPRPPTGMAQVGRERGGANQTVVGSNPVGSGAERQPRSTADATVGSVAGAYVSPAARHAPTASGLARHADHRLTMPPEAMKKTQTLTTTIDRAGCLGCFVPPRDPSVVAAAVRATAAATEALRRSVVTRGGHVMSRAGAASPRALPKPSAAAVAPAGFGTRPITSFAGGVGKVVVDPHPTRAAAAAAGDYELLTLFDDGRQVETRHATTWSAGDDDGRKDERGRVPPAMAYRDGRGVTPAWAATRGYTAGKGYGGLGRVAEEEAEDPSPGGVAEEAEGEAGADPDPAGGEGVGSGAGRRDTGDLDKAAAKAALAAAAANLMAAAAAAEEEEGLRESVYAPSRGAVQTLDAHPEPFTPHASWRARTGRSFAGGIVGAEGYALPGWEGYSPRVYATGEGKHCGRHGDATARAAREAIHGSMGQYADDDRASREVIARYERSLTAMTPAVLANGWRFYKPDVNEPGDETEGDVLRDAYAKPTARNAALHYREDVSGGFHGDARFTRATIDHMYGFHGAAGLPRSAGSARDAGDGGGMDRGGPWVRLDGFAGDRLAAYAKAAAMKAEVAESAYPALIERRRHVPIQPLPPVPAPTPNTLRTGFDARLKAKAAEEAASGRPPHPAGVKYATVRGAVI